MLADLFQEIHLRTEVDIDLPDRRIDALLCSNKQVGRIDIQFILFIYLLPCLRVERRQTVNLISPKLDAISHAVKRFDGGENIDCIAVHTKTTAVKLQFVVHI